MHTQIKLLKSSIKALAAEGLEIHKQIIALRSVPDSGPDRDQLWRKKRDLGSRTRAKLLAYAMLRGRSYASVEPKCRVGNAPWALDVSDAAGLDRKLGAELVRSWLSRFDSATGQALSAETSVGITLQNPGQDATFLSGEHVNP